VAVHARQLRAADEPARRPPDCRDGRLPRLELRQRGPRARLGLGRVLAASSAATAGSALAYALAPVWEVVVVSAVVAGLGAGAIDAGINAFAAARLSAHVTTWLHASYGIGATLGPLLTGAVLGTTGSWRMAYGLIGAVLAAMTIGFVRTEDRWAVEEGPAPLARMAPGFGEALRRPAVWLSVGLFFVYAGLEVGVGQWGYSWLVEGAAWHRVAPRCGSPPTGEA
jgi:MFS family permease